MINDGFAHGLWAAWEAYRAPLLALVAGLLTSVGLRLARWRPAGEVGGVVGILVGWAVLALSAAPVRRVIAPVGLLEALVLPGVLALIVAGTGSGVPGRLGRWLPFAVAAFGAWWLARVGAGPIEFWRAWFAGTLLCVLLGRSVREDRGRLIAAALALWAALLTVHAPLAWQIASLVVAAGALTATLAGARDGMRIMVTLIALGALGADLAAGRLLRGAVGGVDAACVAPLAAAWLTPRLAVRLRRLGRARKAAAIVGATLIAAALAWLAGRLLAAR